MKTTNILTKAAFFAAVMIFLIGFTTESRAATYTVDTTADNGALMGCHSAANDCSLRGAIAKANATSANDTINFDAGVFGSAQTITLGGTELTITNNGSLTINGTGANNLTVSGGNLSRVFFINAGANATISGLTISNGNGYGTLSYHGGGIYNHGTLNLINSTVTNNKAGFSGTLGGSGGGGIFNHGGTLNVTNSAVSNNEAGLGIDGGGIYNTDNGTVNITNSTVSNNYARDGGGIFSGVDASLGTVNLINSTFSGNSVSGNGGGIFIGSEYDILNVINSTISSNRAAIGAGIYSKGVVFDSRITNSTISNNAAAFGAAGIYNLHNQDTINVENSIIANSTIANLAPGDDCFGVSSISYSLVEDGSCGVVEGVNNNKTGDPLLGPLQDNGGATPTHALLPGSPAIDKGSSFSSTTDQRGTLRPADFDSIPNAGDGADIGAFEMQVPTAASVSLSGRVLNHTGKGIARARLKITNTSGETRTVQTNPFGYYRFNDVLVGEIYVITIISKGYYFTPQVIFVTEDISGLNFTVQNSL